MTHAHVRALRRRSGFRSRRAVLTAVVAILGVGPRLRRRYIRTTTVWANTHDPHGPLRRVSAVPALISGKPPQIRPANSASLSLIVAKEDGESEGKGKRSRAPPFGTAARRREDLPYNPAVAVYFFTSSPSSFSFFFFFFLFPPCVGRARIRHFHRRRRSFGLAPARFCEKGKISRHLAKRGKNGDCVRGECVIKDGPGRSLAGFCVCKRVRGRIFIRRSWVFHGVYVNRKLTSSMTERGEENREKAKNKLKEKYVSRNRWDIVSLSVAHQIILD